MLKVRKGSLFFLNPPQPSSTWSAGSACVSVLRKCVDSGLQGGRAGEGSEAEEEEEVRTGYTERGKCSKVDGGAVKRQFSFGQ